MLYLVSTPIGNLKDITLRALETLKECDLIACEDTRHSIVLLNHYGIKKPLVSLHKYNETEEGLRLIEKLKEGQIVCYISDAGMPGISDPGEKLVNLCIEHGVPYTVLPGANAALSALVLSGFSSTDFSFLGFLPDKNAEREKLLGSVVSSPFTLIFYSAPHNLLKEIGYIYEKLGNRRVCAVKEISKIYERAEFFNLQSCPIENPRGEYVLVVEGVKTSENPLNGLTVKEHLKFYIQGGMNKMDAVKQVSKDRGMLKNDVYQAALELK